MASVTSFRPDKQDGSRFILSLYRDLNRVLVPEMELTLKVAVYSASGYTRAQIVHALDATDLEVKMALERLKKIASGW